MVCIFVLWSIVVCTSIRRSGVFVSVCVQAYVLCTRREGGRERERERKRSDA